MGIKTKLTKAKLNAPTACPRDLIHSFLANFLNGHTLPAPAYNGMTWPQIEAAFDGTRIGVMMVCLDSMKSIYSTPKRDINVAIVVTHGHAYMVEAQPDMAPAAYSAEFMDCPSLTCIPAHLAHHAQGETCGDCDYHPTLHVAQYEYVQK